MLCMCCGILLVCRVSLHWPLWRPRDSTKGVDIDQGDHAEFIWKNECQEEFEVNVSCEFIRVDKEGIEVAISTPIP